MPFFAFLHHTIRYAGWLLLCLCALLPTTRAAQPEAVYYTITPTHGEGIFAVLRKYELEAYECNINQFYRLNKLKKNQTLQKGKTYRLPLLIYTFNGKNIRSSIDNDDYDLAKKIEAYNTQMLHKQLRKNSYKTDKELWVPFHLLNCKGVEKEVPSAAGERVFPIFGKDYEKVPLLDNSLSGRVFYVVSGHGGPDPGAMGKCGNHTLCEDEYAYDVALRLVRLLIERGATAYMIIRDDNDGIRNTAYLECDEDEKNWDEKPFVLDQKQRLQQRIDVINALFFKHKRQGITDQRLIEIHIDSRAKHERADVFFYYQPNSEKGKKLAYKLYDKLVEKYKRHRPGNDYQGKVQARGLYMLQWSKPTSVYIELANIRNAADQKRLVVESNRQLLALWLLEGLQ